MAIKIMGCQFWYFQGQNSRNLRLVTHCSLLLALLSASHWHPQGSLSHGINEEPEEVGHSIRHELIIDFVMWQLNNY